VTSRLYLYLSTFLLLVQALCIGNLLFVFIVFFLTEGFIVFQQTSSCGTRLSLSFVVFITYFSLYEIDRCTYIHCPSRTVLTICVGITQVNNMLKKKEMFGRDAISYFMHYSGLRDSCQLQFLSLRIYIVKKLLINYYIKVWLPITVLVFIWVPFRAFVWLTTTMQFSLAWPDCFFLFWVTVGALSIYYGRFYVLVIMNMMC